LGHAIGEAFERPRQKKDVRTDHSRCATPALPHAARLFFAAIPNDFPAADPEARWQIVSANRAYEECGFRPLHA
jgi:hypothetical protein